MDAQRKRRDRRNNPQTFEEAKKLINSKRMNDRQRQSALIEAAVKFGRTITIAGKTYGPKKKDAKKLPERSKAKPKKESKEATGSISAATTKAGNKPLSMGAYRSMTSKERAAEKLKASQMERAGQITKPEMKAIHKKIDDANAAEVRASSAKRSGSNAPVSLPQLEKGKPDRELRKGGMPFNRGGMSSHKGNFDMRKGGMFAK